MSLRIGLIINPIAGMGGSVGLKGTDGTDILQQAINKGALPKSQDRVLDALDGLVNRQAQFTIYTVSGDMGENVCRTLSLNHEVVYQCQNPTTAEDSMLAAAELMNQNIDLLLFAGGDGTARNILDVVDSRIPVLGIPAGCKIHSAVYTVTPKATTEVLKSLLDGDFVDILDSDVMDIDEGLFRQGKVKAKRYGEMRVPRVGQFVQATKVGGIEDESMVLDDIADFVLSELDGDELVIMGSGSTCAVLMEHLNLPNTLLGVDLIHDGGIIKNDVTASDIMDELKRFENVKLFITVIGGQGHIFGRGNQQLTPQVLRKIGKDNIQIVATKSKLKSLEGHPLILDTGDSSLDQEWKGLWNICTGYNDHVLYPAGF